MSPNQPRADNPARAVRIHKDLWARVLAVSKRNETTASSVVRDALEDFLPKIEETP